MTVSCAEISVVESQTSAGLYPAPVLETVSTLAPIFLLRFQIGVF